MKPMKSKKNSLSGTAGVYRFTLNQMVKGKANILTLVILVLAAMAASPIMAFLGGESGTEKSGMQQTGIYTDGAAELLNAEEYSEIGASEEQLSILISGYATDTQSVDKYLEPEDTNMETRFAVQMMYSILVLVLCVFTTSYVVQKVVEEKASKLTEMLMVSIKPLALLIGKILAVMTYICGLMLLLGTAFLVSAALTENYTGVDTAAKLLEAMQLNASAIQLSAGMAAVFAVSLVLGYLTISFLAGLLGAACSSMDEVEPVNLIVVLLVMVGYLAAMITAPLDMGTGFSAAMSLIPILSVFCTPVYFLMGNISAGILLLSWLIQVFLLVLLWYGCAKVYRDLMLYRGSRMKAGQIFAMMSGNRRKGGDRS